jgi:hypothetical protein
MVEARTSAPSLETTITIDDAVERLVYDPRLREVLARRGVTRLMPVQVAAIGQGCFTASHFWRARPPGRARGWWARWRRPWQCSTG